jgi:hypothetical protein
MKQDSINSKKIAIFEDSTEGYKRYEELFKAEDAYLIPYFESSLDDVLRLELEKIKPDLFIIDLIMGGSREDGYKLIREIQKIDSLKTVPIVICSKLINSSPGGMIEKEKCLKFPGVVAVYGKVPDIPKAGEFLRWIHDKKV